MAVWLVSHAGGGVGLGAVVFEDFPQATREAIPANIRYDNSLNPFILLSSIN